MVVAAQHPNITLYTYSEVEEVSGYIGNFDVKIKKKARYVDLVKCTGCGICETKCPTKVASEFDLGLGKRPCIYKPFPQAVPNKPVIDPVNCKKLINGKCGVCEKVCPTGAIVYDDKDEIITEKVGAIVMATGFDLFDWTKTYGEYGYGEFPDVITGLHFERLMNAAGPTGGKLKRPSDGKIPQTVVFVKCVGSRDENKGHSFCSRTCCMYTAKHSMQVLEKIPNSEAYVFYMDVRTPGKAYEEFYQRAVDQGAKYLRGRVSKVYQKGDKLVVLGEDTLLGQQVEVEADLVVLATAMVPSKGYEEISQRVGFGYDKDGFFSEAHPKLRPVETNTGGVFVAGACQGPKDVPDTVSQASAAAVKAVALLSKDKLATNPRITSVNEARCSGCMMCASVCPYKAIEAKTITERAHGHNVERTVASVNSGLCQGCGACTVNCRSSALNLKGFTHQQMLAEVDAACR